MQRKYDSLQFSTTFVVNKRDNYLPACSFHVMVLQLFFAEICKWCLSLVWCL